ncbi:RNA polymerase sigma factor [Pedobacter antarcticus]|uniref:RNA polymerase sigma factor n=1 Tax=Pedobacter antarcticus TaxID=34086 RepID=UPI000887F98D|nr:RNA polymerase sigma-70 factor [Pedobacter antarcticus]SDM37632.1 RNA polymerase sigma-70 factor, ECF subfamily [Pedobacter antarcticus]
MRVNPFPNEQSVLIKIAAGDHQAFREVYDFYYQSIYKYALHLLKSELLAEEIIQETFLKIWINRLRLPEILNLESYLVTIARNRSLDILRQSALRYRKDQTLKNTFEFSTNETEEQIILKDTRLILSEAIAQLPPQQKQVYELCKQQGLKYDEVAKIMNLSPLTVQSYMKIALRAIREYMDKNTDIIIMAIILKLF